MTLPPGNSATILVTVIPPTIGSSTLPVYSGWITIISDKESTQVPYLGAAAALKDKQVLDSSDYYFGVALPAIIDAAGAAATLGVGAGMRLAIALCWLFVPGKAPKA